MSDVEFCGEQFTVPARINKRLLIRFAAAAARGTDSNGEDGAVLLDRLLDQCVRDEDRQRFDDLCDKVRVEDEQLMEYIGKVIGALSERPTSQPSDSSAGPTSTELTSVSEEPKRSAREDAALTLLAQAEEQGRPDRGVFLLPLASTG